MEKSQIFFLFFFSQKSAAKNQPNCALLADPRVLPRDPISRSTNRHSIGNAYLSMLRTKYYIKIFEFELSMGFKIWIDKSPNKTLIIFEYQLSSAIHSKIST